MRILLAEDDELLGSGIRAGLAQHGFQVDWVRDGVAAERDSLILRLPLLLHERLPRDLVAGLVRDLALQFETDWGLASEAVASPLFEPEGYWRGPVWPAPMFLLITALREAGYPEMAARLREKFFQLVARGGMAENFQPQTGAGLSDTGFSWTAAVYLLLSEEA